MSSKNRSRRSPPACTTGLGKQRRRRSERIEVYCPRGVKGEALEVVGQDESSLSSWVVSLIRAAIADAKKFARR